MKKIGIMIIVILMLSATGLLTACSPAGTNTAASEKPAETTASPSASGSVPSTDGVMTSEPANTPALASASAPAQPPSAAPASGVNFEEKTYSEGAITIKYPQITGMSDSAAQEKLNKIISDTALRDVKDLQSGTEYELNYTVTFNTPSVISMYFDGYANVPGAAHPYQFLRSVTIDVKKQEAVPLSALVSINEGFIDLLLNGRYTSMSYDMTDEYRSSIKDNLSSLGTDFWLGELRNADTPGHETSSYLTEDALVISVSVPHVMGDHIEINLTFKELKGYQTDNLLWEEIIS